ncbi:MAG TPA: 30S ribosomal protein S8 [Thermoleophilia bacterium]|jgi:small subunit ribosomal protein S8|nr:30S ribosomal protein S8 [Thermoleophilia bacterium]
MSMTDPIADMLTRVRNASAQRHSRVEMPTSRMKLEIARIMTEQGYVSGYDVVPGEHGDVLRIELKYGRNRERVISGIKRVSKPGRRIYARKDSLPKVLGGLGTAVISTSRGLVTSAEAKKLGVGGEVICFIW